MKLKINRFSVANPTVFGEFTTSNNGTYAKYAIGMDVWKEGTVVHVKPYLYSTRDNAYGQHGSKRTVTIGSFYKETAATQVWPNSEYDFISSGRSDEYKYYADCPWWTSTDWSQTQEEFTHDQIGQIYVECSFTGNTTTYYAPKKGATIKASTTITTATKPTGLTCSVSSYSDTTATLSGSYSDNGGATVTSSGYQYKVNGGSWTNCTANLSNLTPNTKYYFRYYATNVAGTSYSAETSITTYDYPKVVSITKNDLKIGESQTVYIYNPTGKAITLYMKKDTPTTSNNNILYQQSFAVNAIKGTNVAYTFTPNATTLYNSIPSSQSATAYYTIARTESQYVKSGTYSVVGNENPIFDSSNFTCVTNLSTLTGDTNTIISNKSTITVTITSAGTKKTNGADISRYVATWGNGTPVEITTLNTPTQLTTGSGGTVTVSCVDARGLSTPVQVALEVVNYNAPTASGSANRQNGVDSNVFLELNGDLFYDKFGDNGVSNAIYSIKYRVSTTTTFSGDGYDIDVSRVTYGTGANNKRSWTLSSTQIFSNGSTAGFTVGTRYYVEISVQDARGLLGTVTLPLVQISDGKIGRDIYQDSNGDYHVGINGMADSNYTQKIHGKQYVDGDIIGNKVVYAESYVRSPNGYKGKVLNGGSGTSGYMYVCDIATTGSYQNQYFKFDVLQRGRIGSIKICFGSSATAGTLIISNIKKTGNISAYYVMSNNVCKIYVQKSEAYDNLEIVDLQKGTYMDATTITWKNTTVTSLPSGYVEISSDDANALSAYPVGAIYISAISTSPAQLFGGNWQQLKSRYLYATGYDQNTGAACGKDNMSTDTGTTTTSTSISHTHGLGSGYAYVSYNWQDNQNRLMFNIKDVSFTANRWTVTSAPTYSTGSYGAWGATSLGGTTDSGNKSHNHTVPYIAVYVWQRTP